MRKELQRRQESTPAAGDDGSTNKQAGNSRVVCAMGAASSGKHQVLPPTNHFKKLLEETCPNHAYPVKHKLRDCIMMKNFISSGSLARGMEVDDVLDEGNTMPFLREDTVMMIYHGHSSPGMRHASDLSIGTPARCNSGCRNTGM
jgi:hypothetical protein